MELTSKTDSLRSMLVIGGGRFGQIALERLGSRVRAVVETQPSRELKVLAAGQGAELRVGQGAAALEDALRGPNPPKWVVPALPSHLLMDWLLLTLPGSSRLPVPRDRLPDLPSVIAGPDQQFFVSRADFLCPDDCPEPADHCTVTKQPRGEDLFRTMARVRAPGMRTAVVRSHQLAPGVGGYKSDDLLELRERVRKEGGDWLLATACRCHGVVGTIRIKAGSGA